MAQLTYTADLPVAVEGQMHDGGYDAFIESRVNTAAEMPFGRAVVRHATDSKEVALPSTGNVNFEGITVFTHVVERGDLTGTGTEGIPVGHAANILRKGRIWVVVEETIAIGDAVFFRHNAPGALPEALGRWRNDADTADATQVTAARWIQGAAAGGLALLEINLP